MQTSFHLYELSPSLVSSPSLAFVVKPQHTLHSTSPNAFPFQCHFCGPTMTTQKRRGPSGSATLCNKCVCSHCQPFHIFFSFTDLIEDVASLIYGRSDASVTWRAFSSACQFHFSQTLTTKSIRDCQGNGTRSLYGDASKRGQMSSVIIILARYH